MVPALLVEVTKGQTGSTPLDSVKFQREILSFHAKIQICLLYVSIFIYLLCGNVHVYMSACMYLGMHLEVRGQFAGVSSSFLDVGFWD